mmetsp:Transcript_24848/g.28626  ORF Transcript_24848/g.28626 Transcript_24848/m.28626 type:complete len:161 (+) Transcript_24848:976-1458(+)
MLRLLSVLSSPPRRFPDKVPIMDLLADMRAGMRPPKSQVKMTKFFTISPGCISAAESNTDEPAATVAAEDNVSASTNSRGRTLSGLMDGEKVFSKPWLDCLCRSEASLEGVTKEDTDINKWCVTNIAKIAANGKLEIILFDEFSFSFSFNSRLLSVSMVT